jgi:hypothetical protein
MTELTAEQQKQEAERQAIEQMMAAMRLKLDEMRAKTPAESERAHQWLKEQCADPRLAGDFKRQVLEKARAYECESNMKATDVALADARRLAAEERMSDRAARLGEAQRFYGKACSLGATEDFRRASGRLIETIMMTGGFRRSGPTRAKPLDIAPKAPNRAKA